MRAPDCLHDLTLDTCVSMGPYPPQGFLPIAEGALGNGDCFGLYWPLGRESEAPVVCEMFHDEGLMVLSHASLDAFAQWLGDHAGSGDVGSEDDDVDPRNDIAQDPMSPLSLMERAQVYVRSGEPTEAIGLLKTVCHGFPDMPRAWAMLASQYQRVGQREEAVTAARSALLANWAFGMPEEGVLRILRTADAGNDPVLAMAQEMRFAFGGAKHNPDYALMQACIERCWQRGDREAALRLSQNRCYVLNAEAVSFQQREGFDLSVWQQDFIEQCGIAFMDDRQGL